MADPQRVDVYRAAHRVEARHARSWLLSNGLDDVRVEDRVFRGAAPNGMSAQEALDHSGHYLRVLPEKAAAAKRLLEEAKQKGIDLSADLGDLRGV